jgi:hypothetical protein
MSWTTARSTAAPLRSDITVVSDVAVGQVATLAKRLSRTDTPVAAYAAGVAAWLEWITGGIPHMTLPWT